ncbi:MAG: hypothetical protein KDD69_00205 [Bdellovibrionales bacterium]|nr:hypothetical protein [Bdellovibrionales bacterium]
MTKQKFERVVGFFVAKGLLVAPQITPRPSVKLDVRDVLAAADEEPRVMEVFPAALIHFPRTFQHQERLPEALGEIVERIRKNLPTGRDYKGISYKKMRHWATKELRDRRTKPVGEKKVMRSYRLSPAAYEKLRAHSEKQGVTETALLEELIRGI